MHRWPFGKIDGPGKWNKPQLNQGPLIFKQTNQKGHLCAHVDVSFFWRVPRSCKRERFSIGAGEGVVHRLWQGPIGCSPETCSYAKHFFATKSSSPTEVLNGGLLPWWLTPSAKKVKLTFGSTRGNESTRFQFNKSSSDRLPYRDT